MMEPLAKVMVRAVLKSFVAIGPDRNRDFRPLERAGWVATGFSRWSRVGVRFLARLSALLALGFSLGRKIKAKAKAEKPAKDRLARRQWPCSTG
jgi:hypothetical protein